MINIKLVPFILMRISGIPFEKLDVLCINERLFDEIYESIETLSNDVEYENQFNQALIRIRKNIKILSQEAALKNGLVLSAPSVLDRIASYQKKEITDFRKKERQTERTIVQYLTRIATKTSPFSTFNQIGLAEIKKQTTLIENAELSDTQSFVRINNHILKSFKDSIVQDRKLVQDLKISINSTLKNVENGYEFLVNDNNIEAFQTLGKHPVVQLILDIIITKKSILFSQLIHELEEEVEAEQEDLEDFVLELNEVGLLEFEINISNLDDDWELKCLELLAGLAKCELSDNWIQILSMLSEAKQRYSAINFRERQILLKTVFNEFSNLFEQINNDIEKSEQHVFKKQFDNQLTFNETNLLYEDYAVKTTTSLSKSGITPLFSKLSRIINALQPLQKNKELEELTDFYKESSIEYLKSIQYLDSQEIGLLDFYKAFSKWKLSKEANNSDVQNFNKQIHEWKSALRNTILIKNDIVNIKIENLEKSISNIKEKKQNQSNSAFLQLYQNGNEFQCFLNSIMPGYGKYFSRFLHLFPDDITQQLREQNKNKTHVFAEINDNSFFNANIHPPLMPFEIKLLDGNNQLLEEQQILLKDIVLVFRNDKLRLIHQVTKKEIIPFDLGFLSLEGRSELFKILSAFSQAKYSSVYQIVNVVNNLIIKESEIQVFPRIIIENQIVIQRKTWIISKTSIPKSQQKHETEWTLYKRIIKWIKENGLPLEGFYTINPKELAKDKSEIRNTDAHKPQYVNFKNPILVQLFIRACKKIETSLKLEEMLPHSDDLLTWNRKKYASEFLIQWKS